MPDIREVLANAVDPATSIDVAVVRARANQRRAHRRLARAGTVVVLFALASAGTLTLQASRHDHREPVTAGPSPSSRVPIPRLPFWSLRGAGAPVLPPGAWATDVVKWRGRWYAGGEAFAPAVTTGLEPVVWTSDDATTWHQSWDTGGVHLGSATTVRFVTTDGALLLFEAGTPGTRLWQTIDGATWREVQLPWQDGYLGSLVSNGRTYLATVALKTGSDELWTSANATTWLPVAFDGGPHRFDAVAASSDTFFVAGADNPAIGRPTIWTSPTTGLHWTPKHLGDASGEVTALALRGSDPVVSITRYRVVNGSTQNAGLELWQSAAGSWDRGTVFNAPPEMVRSIVAVPLGFVGFPTTGNILVVSGDGRTWTAVGGPAQVDQILASALDGDDLLVLTSRTAGTDAWRVSLAPPPVTSTTLVAAPACRTGDLSIALAGIGGVNAGQWSATYWMSNRSKVACSLPSSMWVDLLRSDGSSLRGIAVMKPVSDLMTLVPGTVPVPNPPPIGTVVWFSVLFRPTDLAAGGSDCPVPLAKPVAIRVKFGTDIGPFRIDQVSTADNAIAYCRDDVSIDGPYLVS
jgi:hypothetical protein